MPGCGGGGGGVTTQKNGRYAWSITPNRRRARHHRGCDDATAPRRGATKWDYAVSIQYNPLNKYIFTKIVVTVSVHMLRANLWLWIKKQTTKNARRGMQWWLLQEFSCHFRRFCVALSQIWFSCCAYPPESIIFSGCTNNENVLFLMIWFELTPLRFLFLLKSLHCHPWVLHCLCMDTKKIEKLDEKSFRWWNLPSIYCTVNWDAWELYRVFLHRMKFIGIFAVQFELRIIHLLLFIWMIDWIQESILFSFGFFVCISILASSFITLSMHYSSMWLHNFVALHI